MKKIYLLLITVFTLSCTANKENAFSSKRELKSATRILRD